MTTNPRTPEPTIRRQELGQQLQALRKASGYTLEEAAARIAVSPQQALPHRKGPTSAATDELGGLLSIYNADPAKRNELLTLASNCGERGWWQRSRPDPAQRQRTLITLESRAQRIVNFEPVMIPGLLQTGEYARAIKEQSRMLTEQDIEEGMAQRVRRQSVLLRREAPDLLAIIDELVLHRVIGNPEVLRQQLDHLLELSQRQHITIRVVPNQGAHAGIIGSFALINQPDTSPVVFLEQPTSNLITEDGQDLEVYGRIVKTCWMRHSMRKNHGA